MLKIRISGSKEDLTLIAKHIGDGEIRKFKQASGKITYSIDTTITVEEFLMKNNFPDNTHDELKSMGDELNEILDIIQDPDEDNKLKNLSSPNKSN